MSFYYENMFVMINAQQRIVIFAKYVIKSTLAGCDLSYKKKMEGKL